MIDAPLLEPVTIHVREAPFAITGSTEHELRLALSILGPLRDGARYAAFTDWEVTYCVRPPEAPTMRPQVDVGALAVVRLPLLRPPRTTPPALVERWSQYVDALRRHERGHVAIARAAVIAVRHALADLPPGAPPPVVQRAASFALAEIHAAERAYDADTRHGATQGAVFFT
jgi:predicted secreted Zn-dependent protease